MNPTKPQDDQDAGKGATEGDKPGDEQGGEAVPVAVSVTLVFRVK